MSITSLRFAFLVSIFALNFRRMITVTDSCLLFDSSKGHFPDLIFSSFGFETTKQTNEHTFEQNVINWGTFLDLPKAFDCIDHAILARS